MMKFDMFRLQSKKSYTYAAATLRRSVMQACATVVQIREN
jgi:hypothetical protein